MKILGLETATSVCSAAVFIDADRFFERSLDAPQVHSQKLLTLVDEVLKQSGETVSSLDGIAVSIGPGSFTGLRIGLSASKGLAYACEKPLVAVSTLEGLACGVIQSHSRDGLILAVLESRKEELYAAMYRSGNGRLIQELVPSALRYNELVERCPKGEEIIMTGNGAPKFLQYCMNEYPGVLHLTPLDEQQRRCSALQIARLGSELLAQDVVADLASVEPVYLKEFYTITQPQHKTGN